MRPTAVLIVAALCLDCVPAQHARAQSGAAPAVVRVRYILADVDQAVSFYTQRLGFAVGARVDGNFAMLSRGNLQLILSPPKGPGGASQPATDGRRPEPGG